MKLRDQYETENLGGYEKLYPPLKPDLTVDEKLLKYY